jgi:hypothetical protein
MHMLISKENLKAWYYNLFAKINRIALTADLIFLFGFIAYILGKIP